MARHRLFDAKRRKGAYRCIGPTGQLLYIWPRVLLYTMPLTHSIVLVDWSS